MDVVARRRREQDERWRSTDMRRLRRRPGVGDGEWHGGCAGSEGVRGSLVFTVRSTSFCTIRVRVVVGVLGEVEVCGGWVREAWFVGRRVDRKDGEGDVVASGPGEVF